MDNYTLSIATTTPCIPEQRRNSRYMVAHLITINTRGTGQVINIGKRGLSFGCLYHHDFPEEWAMDILDAKGSHIKKIQVRKIWEVAKEGECCIENFDIEVGVEFVNLSTLQSEELNSLLINLDFPCEKFAPAY